MTVILIFAMYPTFLIMFNLAGIHIRVLDPFTIKPLDNVSVLEHVRACDGRVVTVEDHYAEGELLFMFLA